MNEDSKLSTVPRAHSAKSKFVNISTKIFSFHGSKSSIKRNLTINNRYTSSSLNESELSTSVIQSKEINTVKDLENRKIILEIDELCWPYECPGFYSLPTRGSKKIKCPRTKTLINSDTFSQTKTLLYTDHQRSTMNFYSRIVDNKNICRSPSSSVDSLNSSNDPEIVAALDQIASSMGLIDEKVSQTSLDPINYLLKSQSFSERIYLRKTSPNNNLNGSRLQSPCYHTKSNGIKPSTIKDATISKQNLDQRSKEKIKATQHIETNSHLDSLLKGDLTRPNYRYINISVSAFGYRPIPSLYRLPHVQRSMYQKKADTSEVPLPFQNVSENQLFSVNEKIISK